MAVARSFTERTISVSSTNISTVYVDGIKAIINHIVTNVPGWSLASVITNNTSQYAVYLTYYDRFWLFLRNNGDILQYSYGSISVGSGVPSTVPSNNSEVRYTFTPRSTLDSITGVTTYILEFRVVLGMLGSFLGCITFNNLSCSSYSSYFSIGFGWCTSKQYGFNIYMIKIGSNYYSGANKYKLYQVILPMWISSNTPTLAYGVTCSASASAPFPDGVTSKGLIYFAGTYSVPILNTAADPNYTGILLPICSYGYYNDSDNTSYRFWGNLLWGGLYDLYILSNQGALVYANPNEFVIVNGTAYQSIFGGLLDAMPSVYA